MWVEPLIPCSTVLKCGGRGCICCPTKPELRRKAAVCGSAPRGVCSSSQVSQGPGLPITLLPASALVEALGRRLLHRGEPVRHACFSPARRAHCVGNAPRMLELEITLTSVFILQTLSQGYDSEKPLLTQHWENVPLPA